MKLVFIEGRTSKERRKIRQEFQQYITMTELNIGSLQEMMIILDKAKGIGSIHLKMI